MILRMFSGLKVFLIKQVPCLGMLAGVCGLGGLLDLLTFGGGKLCWSNDVFTKF